MPTDGKAPSRRSENGPSVNRWVRALTQEDAQDAVQELLDDLCILAVSHGATIVRPESPREAERAWTATVTAQDSFLASQLFGLARQAPARDVCYGVRDPQGHAAYELICVPLVVGVDQVASLAIGTRTGGQTHRATEVVAAWAPMLAAVLYVQRESDRRHLLVSQYARGFQTLDRQLRVLDLERQKLAAVLNNAEIGFLVLNRDLRVTWANPAMAQVLNAAQTGFGILKQSCHEVVCGQSEPCPQCPARQAHTEGEARRIEIASTNPDQPRRLYTTAVPIRDSSGSVQEVLLMVQDLTGIDALRQSESRYRLLFESSLDAIFMAAPPDFRIVMANPATYSLLACGPERIGQLALADIHRPEDWQRMEVRYRSVLDGRALRSEDCLILDRGGRTLCCNVIALPFDLGDKTVVMCNLRDITARTEAEQLLQYRLKFENLISTLSTHFINLGTEEIDGGIRDALRSIGEFAGVDRSYIFQFSQDGRRFSNTHEWCAPGIAPQMDRIQDLPTDGFPWFMERMHSQHVVHVPRVSDLPEEAKSERTEFEAQHIRSLIAVPMIYGKSILGFLGFDSVREDKRWADDVVSLLQIACELFANTLARERAESEKANLEEQLRQSQKMEAVGTLAGGIAHDFNNLLTGILGYADMLGMGGLSSEQIHKAADVIEKAARRAAELTQQLLGFARKGKYQNIPVDIHATIAEVDSLIRRTFDKNIRLKQHLEAADAFVLGDPVQLQQVILNLSVNARDAMPDGGTLTFETRRVRLNRDPDNLRRDREAREYIRLMVSDTGHGIPADVQPRIFEPFFTTKEPGKGTGMGLSMVYGIVKNHGGSICVSSEVGKGTRFDILWPAVDRPALVEEPGEQTDTGKSEATILVVDDEELVRSVASTMLETLGYRVLTAKDGVEALEIYRNVSERIQLVILDMAMPRMGGRECFRQLRTVDPHVRAILSTGYALDEPTQSLLDEGMAGFAKKPYVLDELARIVQVALEPDDARPSSGLKQDDAGRALRTP